MRIALTVWNGRIAPVFDVAGTVRLVDQDGESIVEDQIVTLPSGSGMLRRVGFLTELEIDVLVCGAISRSVHRLILASGIKIHSFISGETDEVLKALLTDTLEEQLFTMPGCGMVRNRQRRGRGVGKRGLGRNRGFRLGRKEV